MKPAIKTCSLLLAVVMLISAILVSGCSFSPEWSYKTSDKELPIGVYIYALRTAYSEAETHAKELEDYDSTKDTWLGMEIEGHDGEKGIARDLIKKEAEETCLKYLAVEKELKAQGATVDSAKIDASREQSKTYWEVGPYASYGYVQPMKKELEKFGVSYDSFAYATADYSVNYSALFDSVYGEGGTQAVSDSELVKFVEENYVDYSYFSVPLYTSQQQEGSDQSTNVALSDEEKKKATDLLNAYVKDIEGGKAYNDVVSAYMTEKSLTESPSTDTIEHKDDFSAGDEVKAAYEKLAAGKATVVTVGEGENATIYFLYKKDIKADAAKYVSENRAAVLSKAKTDDFDKYLEGLVEKLEYEKSPAVDKYDPKMFFVAVEPTTEASAESGNESSAASGNESSAASGNESSAASGNESSAQSSAE